MAVLSRLRKSKWEHTAIQHQDCSNGGSRNGFPCRETGKRALPAPYSATRVSGEACFLPAPSVSESYRRKLGSSCVAAG